MAPHRAAELTWTELAALAPNAVALLPIGSTEAHGPHLPLATDVIIAEAVCARVSDRLGARKVEAVVFPSVAYGLTEFAKPFAGTVGIGAAEVSATVRDACLAIARAGFRAIAAVNHHLEPAHFRAVREGVKAAHAQGAKACCPDHRRPPWAAMLGDEFTHGGAHAGLYETSLVLAAAPDLVRDSIRENLPPVEVDLSAAIKRGATDFLAAGGPQAYFGHPGLASAVEGARLLEILADATVAAIDALE